MPPRPAPSGCGSSSRERAAMEEPPLDRGALDDRTLLGLEAVDARREQRLDRRRHGRVGCLRVVGEHREQLLDEERIALGRLDDPALRLLRGARRPRSKPSDEARRLVRVEWVERDERRATTRRGPRRPRVEEIRTGEAEQQDRRVAREPDHVLEQVEQRGLGPVDVVHDDDQRPVGSERLEETAERPRRLLRRAGAPRRAPTAPAISRAATPPRSTSSRRRERRLRMSPATSLDDVGEREVRDALAVRRAAADQHAGLRLDGVDELAREPRLADPGRADDRRERAGASGDRRVECAPELVELTCAPDERRADRTGERGHVRP